MARSRAACGGEERWAACTKRLRRRAVAELGARARGCGGVRCCGARRAREVRRRGVRWPAACGARGGRRAGAVAGAVRCGGDSKFRQHLAPPLSLRTRCGGEGEGGEAYRWKCHRSRALGTPGTFDSSFPGGMMARDLCAAINAAVSPFAA